MAPESAAESSGRVTSVRGGVVDARFSEQLPEIHRLLRTVDGEFVVEVMSQLDEEHVRGIALTDTRGLARGDAVENLGRPAHVPVGSGLKGRMLDVFGRPIDGKGPVDTAAVRPQRRAPVSIACGVRRGRPWARGSGDPWSGRSPAARRRWTGSGGS